MNNVKNHRQFSLASLFIGTLSVAVICAALPYPHAMFYAVLAFFFFAAILARFGPTGARAFWFWFSLCGWIYVVSGISLLDAVERAAWWGSIRDWLQNNSPVSYSWAPEHYLLFAHSICAMGVAFAGATVASLLTGVHRSDLANRTTSLEPRATAD